MYRFEAAFFFLGESCLFRDTIAENRNISKGRKKKTQGGKAGHDEKRKG